MKIIRHCYSTDKRPRIWWWKIVNTHGDIIADGFSSKAEAKQWLAMNAPQPKGDR